MCATISGLPFNLSTMDFPSKIFNYARFFPPLEGFPLWILGTKISVIIIAKELILYSIQFTLHSLRNVVYVFQYFELMKVFDVSIWENNILHNIWRRVCKYYEYNTSHFLSSSIFLSLSFHPSLSFFLSISRVEYQWL